MWINAASVKAKYLKFPFKMADDAAGMDVDEEEIETPSSSCAKGDRKRFEVKKVKINFPMHSK